MKLKSILFLLTFSFMLNMVFAQKKSFSQANTKHNLKFGLNANFYDSYPLSLAWEFKVANRQSLQVDVLPVFFKNDYSSESGLSLGLSYRKYISKNKEGLQGLYFSPFVNYKFSNSKDLYNSSTSKYKDNTLNLGFLFGKQWIYKSGFSLDINGGLGYYISNSSTNYSGNYPYPGYTPRNYNYNNYGITPNLNIKIGYAF